MKLQEILDFLKNFMSKSFLCQAMELGRPYIKKVAPKPAVGAILVKDNKVIGKGTYSNPNAGAHAEIQALKQAGRKARGATMHVSLEPCTWWPGKQTGSCAKALIKAGVARVVIGKKDLNPKVNGKGIRMLKKAGVKVEMGGSYVLMKTAMSLDSKIAGSKGKRILFSNKKDQVAVQKLRAQMDAILVGGHTLLWDQPRLIADNQPAKVAVIGNANSLNIKNRFFKTGGQKIIFTTTRTSKNKIKQLQKVAQVYVDAGKKVNLAKMIKILAEQGIYKIMLEGGGILNYEMLKAGLVNEIRVAVAPRIVGETKAPCLIQGSLDLKLKLKKVEKLDNMLVTWYEV